MTPEEQAKVEEADRLAAQTAADKAASEKLTAQAEADKAEADKLTAQASADKAAAEKLTAQAEADKAEADKLTAQAEADKAAAVKASAETTLAKAMVKATAKAATAKPKETEKPTDEQASGGVIWTQPGHSQYAVGQYIPTDAATATVLRGKGWARHATEEEVAMYTPDED